MTSILFLTETLFQKQKAFSQYFLVFLKSTLIFEHLQKKDDLHS